MTPRSAFVKRLRSFLPNEPRLAERVDAALDEMVAESVIDRVAGPLRAEDGTIVADEALVLTNGRRKVVILRNDRLKSVRTIAAIADEPPPTPTEIASELAAIIPIIDSWNEWSEIRDRARWVDPTIVVPQAPSAPPERGVRFSIDAKVDGGFERDLLTGDSDHDVRLTNVSERLAKTLAASNPEPLIRAAEDGKAFVFEEDELRWLLIPGHATSIPVKRDAIEFIDERRFELGEVVVELPAQAAKGANEEALLVMIADRAEEEGREKRRSELVRFMAPIATEAIIALAENDGKLLPSRLNHLLAGGDAERSTRRIQAAKALGALKNVVPEHPELVEAIDAGRQLLPALREAFPTISKASLRLLSATDPAMLAGGITGSVKVSPKKVIEALAAVRPDAHPDRASVPIGDAWRCFLSTWDAIARISDECKLSPSPIMALERPQWLDGKFPKRTDAIATKDAMLGFLRHVLRPIGIEALAPKRLPGDAGYPFALADAIGESGRNGVELMQLALLRGKSVARMEEMAKRWHAEGACIGAAMTEGEKTGEKTENLSWPPIAAPRRNADGVEVRAIVSANGLVDESNVMDHCVGRGAYLPKCLYDVTHILSLRDADGRRLSTAEIEIEKYSSTVEIKVIQHRGPSNAVPDERARIALDEWRRDVSQGRIEIDVDGLEAARNERRERRGEHEAVELVGYDPSDRKIREAMFRAYSFMLPREERSLSLVEWIERKGIGAAAVGNVRLHDERRNREEEEAAERRRIRLAAREKAAAR